MKRTGIFILLAALNMTAMAASFNEEDLIGSWELISHDGTYPTFTTYPFTYDGDYSIVPPPAQCKYLYLGTLDASVSLPGTSGSLNNGTVFTGGLIYPENTNLTATEEWDYDDYENIFEIAIPLEDFYISNENKLHITWMSGFANRFIIDQLDNQKMVLKSYDKKFTVTYQRVSSSNVNAISDVNSDTTDYYNLQGMRLKNVAKGINIIHRNGKYIKQLK